MGYIGRRVPVSDGAHTTIWTLRMALDLDVKLGTLITAATAIICVTIYIATIHSDEVNMAKSLDAMQTRLDGMATTKNFDNLKADMTGQFDGIRRDIANLPSVAAELTQMGRREDNSDSRINAISQHVEDNARALDALRNRSDDAKSAFANIFPRLERLEAAQSRR